MKTLLVTLAFIALCNAAEDDWTISIFKLTSGDPTVTGNPRTVVISRTPNAVVLVIQEGGRKGQRTKIVSNEEFLAFTTIVRKSNTIEDDGEIGCWVTCEYLHDGKVLTKKFIDPIPNGIELVATEGKEATAYSAYRDLIRKSAQQGDAPEPATNVNPALPTPSSPAR